MICVDGDAMFSRYAHVVRRVDIGNGTNIIRKEWFDPNDAKDYETIRSVCARVVKHMYKLTGTNTLLWLLYVVACRAWVNEEARSSSFVLWCDASNFIEGSLQTNIRVSKSACSCHFGEDICAWRTLHNFTYELSHTDDWLLFDLLTLVYQSFTLAVQ